MTANVPNDTGWVEPAKPIRGLDHLGVQAPCVALYAQLLPGITNVTDRARYYSFHPWLIRSFEQRYADHSVEAFRRVLRRAECLFALVAIRHAREVGDGDDGRHGAGMVGRLSLLRIPEDARTINLDEHAALEGANRYFLNKLGGLGQYYFGPLRDLRVLDYASQGEGAMPGYDKVRGADLADAFGAGVPQDDFFRLMERSRIGWADLDGLKDFCPCALRRRKAEQTLLLDLFFARTEAYRSPEAGNRRTSLALVLDLLSRVSPLEGYTPESVFRAAAYTDRCLRERHGMSPGRWPKRSGVGRRTSRTSCSRLRYRRSLRPSCGPSNSTDSAGWTALPLRVKCAPVSCHPGVVSANDVW